MRTFLACLAVVPLLFSFTYALDATEELKVRTTLSQFTIFIDDDDFDHLDQIFTQDVFADYGPGATSDGLPAFAAFLKLGLEGLVSQHAISSTVINDLGDSLNSTAYVTAAFLGPGNTTTSVGSAVTLYGSYIDTWTRAGDAWRINERTVKYFVSAP